MSNTTIIKSTLPQHDFELTIGEEKIITSIANNNGVYDTVEKEKIHNCWLCRMYKLHLLKHIK